jgi:tetratricopeptide (TPR) repeat protein
MTHRRAGRETLERPLLGLFILLVVVGFVAASRAADELDLYADEQKRLIDDSARPIAERQRMALSLARTLDRAAQGASSVEARRSRWSQAIAILDAFNSKNPRHSEADVFALQASIFVWAHAHSWIDQVEVDSGATAARRRAIELLDESVHRLSNLVESRKRSTDPLSETVRFRLARALEDRAQLSPEKSRDTEAWRERALALLSPPIKDESCRSFANLLEAEVLSGLKRFDEALEPLDAIAKGKTSPPVADLISARITVLLGMKRLGDAWKALEECNLEGPRKDLLAVRVRLAQRSELAPGKDRVAAETDLFRRCERLRKAETPDGRAALRDLARSIREPDPELGADAWDTLAEGRLLLGDPVEASRLDSKGADAASSRDQPDLAAQLRFRAGGILFQAGKFVEADALFSRLAADNHAGSVRPRAGLLRALARGRALAAKRPDFQQVDYVRALEDQIRDFPEDSTSFEARWLLGLARLASGDRQGASSLWQAIPRDRPRGLDAKLALMGLEEDQIEADRQNGDPSEVVSRMDRVRKEFEKLRDESPAMSDRAEIELARARLELIPEVGRPEEAQAACEHALGLPHRADVHRRARMLRAVALAERRRFSEAEGDIRLHVSEASTQDLMELASRLDRAASHNESDTDRRRIGQILRQVLKVARARTDELAPADQAETGLRYARTLLFSGDPDAAKAVLPSLSRAQIRNDSRLLRELADLYERLDLNREAVDAYRDLAGRLEPGTLGWFAARYGQAAAYARSKEPQAARRLIEATSLLHSEMGGAVMKSRFARLRMKLDPGGAR